MLQLINFGLQEINYVIWSLKQFTQSNKLIKDESTGEGLLPQLS